MREREREREKDRSTGQQEKRRFADLTDSLPPRFIRTTIPHFHNREARTTPILSRSKQDICNLILNAQT